MMHSDIKAFAEDQTTEKGIAFIQFALLLLHGQNNINNFMLMLMMSEHDADDTTALSSSY